MRMSVEAWREVLETNLFGAFYMTKAVTRPMLKATRRPDHQHHLGVRPGRPDGPGELLVGEGRADRADQGDGARARLARHHLSTPSRPGFVLTELTQDLPEALTGRDHRPRRRSGRFGTTEEIADAVAFLASDEAALHHRARSSPSTAAW